MVTTGIAHAYLVSGWCGKCGRKRDSEGICENCDRWWNSPMLMVGLPIILSTVLLLGVGIRSLRDADPGFARWEATHIAARPTVTTAPVIPSASSSSRSLHVGSPFAPIRTTAPAPNIYTVPVATVAAVTPSALPNPLETQYAQLEDLRDHVHYMEATYRGGGINPPAQGSSIDGSDIPQRSHAGMQQANGMVETTTL